MFHGSIPAQMRAFVAETVTSWEVPSLYVGCSGNFTIERTLPDLAHHGNDVTLYSSVMGWWAAGDPMPVALNEEALAELPWLADSMNRPVDVLATVMLGTRFFASVGRDNHYHRRQVEAHRAQWDRLHSQTVERIERSGLKLESYVCKDVRAWLREDVPADAAVACFPPFFEGDYESQGKVLERWIDWTPPEYELLDEDGKVDMVRQITERPHWLLGLHHRWDDLEPYLRGVVQTTNRGVPIYLYASDGPVRVVVPRQQIEQVSTPRIGIDTELTGTEKVTLSTLTSGQFSSLRSQYMSRHIRPGSPLLALGILIGGQLAGCIAFGTPNNKFDARCAYLLSDFPVYPARYSRLSALMVKLAQSTEVKLLLERSSGRKFHSVDTTAFTNRMVSMKYRSGGMKLISRKPATDGVHTNQLQYSAPIGQWSLAEGYADWFKKHGKKTIDTERLEAE